MTKTLVRKAIAALALAAAVTTTTQSASACGWASDYSLCAGYDVDVTANSFTSDSWSYVIPDVGTRYLSDAELDQFSGLYLMLARNEIYARHGYIFNDQNIARYFEYKDWYYGYVPSCNFSAAVFNDYEEYNLSRIIAEENSRGGAVQTIQWYN